MSADEFVVIEVFYPEKHWTFFRQQSWLEWRGFVPMCWENNHVVVWLWC